MRRVFSVLIVMLVVVFVSPENLLQAQDTGSLRYFSQAGDLEARFYLGERYLNGDGVNQDMQSAARLFRSCVSNWARLAGIRLGQRYTDKEPVAVLRPVAEGGDFEAQYALGNKFYFGNEVGKDHAEAAKWFHRAAQDCGRIDFQHGYLAHTPEGQAMANMERRAVLGDREALAILRGHRGSYPGPYGVLPTTPYPDPYFPGSIRFPVLASQFTALSPWRGGYPVVANPSWLRHPQAMTMQEAWDAALDPNFYSPDISSEDLAALRRDVELGDPFAQFNLASRYYFGAGVAQDYQQATKLFRMIALREAALASAEQKTDKFANESLIGVKRAAESGDLAAQFNLANRYHYGTGTAVNLEQAARWYREVVVNGRILPELALPTAPSRTSAQREPQVPGSGEPAVRASRVHGRLVDPSQWALYPTTPGWYGSSHWSRFDPWYYRSFVGLEAAAAKGDADARYLLERSAGEPSSWYPWVPGRYSYGPLYYSRHGSMRLDRRDLTTLREAALQGDAEAQHELGARYYFGNGVTQDRAEAARWFRLANQAGHTVSRYNLGVMYGAHEDVKALQWAADAGNSEAQATLAARFYFGDGCPQNLAEAERLFKLAALKGDAMARFFLGIMAFRRNDTKEAQNWLEKAAHQGYLPAQFNLAAWLSTGRGVEVNVSSALRWFTRAAEKGSAWAQGCLAQAYLLGDGVPVNQVEGRKWHRRSSVSAMFNPQLDLSLLNSEGFSFPETLIRGYAWYSFLAGVHPAPLRDDCLLVRQTIAGRLSPADLAKGEELCRALQLQEVVSK